MIFKKGDKVKPFKNKYGYIEYILSDKKGKRKHIQAHRIIACLFIPNIYNKKYVNHIDGDKTNNTPDNLMVVTNSEHQKIHAAMRKAEKENNDV